MSTAQIAVPLRWTDLDAQGHVNNVCYAEYLQQARAVCFRADQPDAPLASGCVVSSHQINYQRPISWDDQPLRVELAISDVGAARFEISYRIFQGDQECAQALTVMCPFDFASQSPRRLSAVEREFLAELAGPRVELKNFATPPLLGRGHRLAVYPRWSDVDRYGHVNNVRFLDYVLAGRVASTTAADPSLARVGMGNSEAVRWLIARQDIDYLGQLVYRPQPYVVLSAPTRLGESSITLASEIIDPLAGDKVLAASRSVLVCTTEKGVKRAIPQSGRQALEKLLISE